MVDVIEPSKSPATGIALVAVSQAVERFNRVAEGLSELSAQYGGVVYDVTTAKGMTEAKAARAAIRKPRYDIEAIRKEAKAPILDLGRKLDAEAARITDELLKLERPIDEQIKNEEERKERERLAKIEAEQKRVTGLQNRVAALRGNQFITAAHAPDFIAKHIAEVEAIVIDESFQEFKEQAVTAKTEGIERLKALHAAAVARVAEEARIRAEREELVRLRAEQAKREAEERARIAEEERKAKAERDALAAKQAEELRLQREEQARKDEEARKAREAEEREHAERLRREREEAERIAAEQRAALAAEEERLRKEREALEAARRTEEERLAAERAEFQRQQEDARRQREAEESRKAEQARIAALKKPDDDELIGVLTAHYNAPAAKVIEWLLAIDFTKLEAAA